MVQNNSLMGQQSSPHRDGIAALYCLGQLLCLPLGYIAFLATLLAYGGMVETDGAMNNSFPYTIGILALLIIIPWVLRWGAKRYTFRDPQLWQRYRMLLTILPSVIVGVGFLGLVGFFILIFTAV